MHFFLLLQDLLIFLLAESEEMLYMRELLIFVLPMIFFQLDLYSFLVCILILIFYIGSSIGIDEFARLWIDVLFLLSAYVVILCLLVSGVCSMSTSSSYCLFARFGVRFVRDNTYCLVDLICLRDD